MKKTTAAFFDIDGTIYRTSLLIEHFKMLLKYEFISNASWINDIKDNFKQWENRKGDYDDYLDRLVQSYLQEIQELNEKDVDFVASRVIELKGDKVYKYTREMLKKHKELGHKIIIISGSPEFIVSKMAKKLEVEDYRGTKYLVENDKYTGNVIPMWDSESKCKAIDEYCEKYNISLEDSYSYGDTTGDISMFRKVGHPVAINPAKKLLNVIINDKEIADKIDIIIERKDVIYRLNPNVETIEIG